MAVGACDVTHDVDITHDEGVHAKYDVVWPKSSLGTERRPPAPRIESLDGQRIAFLWDFVFRGDELFPVLERELTARHPGVEIVGYDEFGNIHGADEAKVIAALPDELAERRIAAVIAGNGC